MGFVLLIIPGYLLFFCLIFFLKILHLNEIFFVSMGPPLSPPLFLYFKQEYVGLTFDVVI